MVLFVLQSQYDSFKSSFTTRGNGVIQTYINYGAASQENIDACEANKLSFSFAEHTNKKKPNNIKFTYVQDSFDAYQMYQSVNITPVEPENNLPDIKGPAYI